MENSSVQTSEITKEDLDRLLKYHVWASAGVGLVPVPVADMVALTAIQINLVRKIAKAYDIPFLKDKVKNILGALLGSAIPSSAGLPLSASIVKSVPVIGQAVGALAMPVIAGASTYAVGKVFIQHFASGGTFLTFDPEKSKAYYTEMFGEGKKIVKESEEIVADISESEAGKEVPAPKKEKKAAKKAKKNEKGRLGD